MSNRPHVLHLVDDATPGGVTRVLAHIQTCPLMARTARHEVRIVSRKSALPDSAADLIVSHLSLSWRRLPALIAFRARHAGTPLVHVEHSYTAAFTALNVPSKLRFFAMLRSSLALFDSVVAVSAAQADWLERRRLAPANALRVIPPVVGLQDFRVLPAPATRPSRIGAIGRLHRQKGFDILIQAFRGISNPDASLQIFGTRPEEAALRTLAHGDGRIQFAGHCDIPAKAMASVDIVAIPSRWEAFGLVALEARAAGRRILTSGIDGLATSAGSDAILVRSNQVRCWKRALSTALSDKQIEEGRVSECENDFAEAWAQLIFDLAKRDLNSVH